MEVRASVHSNLHTADRRQEMEVPQKESWPVRELDNHSKILSKSNFPVAFVRSWGRSVLSLSWTL